MNQGRIDMLVQFIEQEPGNPFNKHALAMEFYDADPARSLDILKSILNEHPDYLPSYFKAAHLLWEEEKWEEADEVFRAGIALAEKVNDQKALVELKSAYQNFQFDRD